MALITTTPKKLPFEYLVRTVVRLGKSERETLEILLDKEFTRTILKRGKEVDQIRKNGGLVSLAEIQREFLQ